LACFGILLSRYQKVIAVVGFNPNKKYAVSPQQRVHLLREMVNTTSAKNIQVEGVYLPLSLFLCPGR